MNQYFHSVNNTMHRNVTEFFCNRLYIIINKTDKLVSDVQEKVSSFDSAFRLVNIISDRLSIGVTTIVDGKVLMENRKLLFADEKEAIKKVNESATRLLK